MITIHIKVDNHCITTLTIHQDQIITIAKDGVHQAISVHPVTILTQVI